MTARLNADYSPIDRPAGQQDSQNQSPPFSSTTTETHSHIGLAFWLLGLLNNAGYVIMLACAKTIDDGGTALVFLANIVPAFCIKLSAPYWFDRVSYRRRILSASVFMVSAFLLVGEFSSRGGGNSTSRVLIQLLGVALGSAQSGLGEASLLAAAGKCDGSVTTANASTSAQLSAVASDGQDENDHAHENHVNSTNNDSNTVSHGSGGGCITCFSSGTGLAGVFGFLWKFVWNDCLHFNIRTTLWLAQTLAVAYVFIFIHFLSHIDEKKGYDNNNYNFNMANTENEDCRNDDENDVNTCTENNNIGNCREKNYNATSLALHTAAGEDPERADHMQQQSRECWSDENADDTLAVVEQEQIVTADLELPVSEMSVFQRSRLVVGLWPYIIPLFLVYAAEYSLQAGTWTAIGFPVSSEEARDEFYEYSNWTYQIGVFLSRSSGTLFTAPMAVLWLMPILQVVNVLFFAVVASKHILYSYKYLIPCCLYVGGLGGAVYVHGYKRICMDFQQIDRREFALATTSVAESLGIVFADISGLFIESCLYKVNNIPGALVTCTFRN